MRPEDLDVALRPRSPWEAMELGTALLRRHAGAIWRPWLLATLPVLALLNALAWWTDLFWLAAVPSSMSTGISSERASENRRHSR